MGGLRPGSEKESAVLPVTRSKSEARRFYNGISQVYDFQSWVRAAELFRIAGFPVWIVVAEGIHVG
jgi:hypothetical protein